MADFNDALYWVQKHYFQAVAMKNFDWEKLKNVNCDESNTVQIAVLNATVLHPLSQKYPPSNTYKLSFLKSLLAVYEKQEREVCDELCNLIAELMAKKKNSEDEFIYKSYILPCRRAVTLCESAQFVSQGTTGLNTWQAGIYLSNWLIQNKSLLQGKTILELGCGVGLTGLATLHCCRPKSYAFTDSNEKVLNKVKENLQINGFCPLTSDQEGPEVCFEERTRVSEDFRSSLGSQNVEECWTCSMCKASVSGEQYSVSGEQYSASVYQLDWERCNIQEIEKFSPDVILASDVIFDPHIIKPLVNVIKVLLSNKIKDQKCQPVAYIASTIRNKDTYEKFLLTLDKSGIKRNQIHSAPGEFVFYDKTSEIVLLRLELS